MTLRKFHPANIRKRVCFAPWSAAAPSINRNRASWCPDLSSLPVGVVLYVDGLVHGRAGGVCLFVRVDRGGVLQRSADIVEALQQNFLARRSNFKFEHQAVFVGDGLVRQ